MQSFRLSAQAIPHGDRPEPRAVTLSPYPPLPEAVGAPILQNQPHDRRRECDVMPMCGRKTRQGTPCRRPAGWGTDHVGEGACKLHGGKSTGPKDQRGNKNAVTTGEYETIWLDTLDDEEQVLFDRIAVDVLRQLDDEIRLVTIRERRMLQRIQRLSESDYTEVEYSEESGIGPMGPVDKTVRKHEATLGQIQAIEEALTRVQREKGRLLDLKHKIESGKGPDDPDIDRYMEALRKSAKAAWAGEGDDDAEA